MFGSLSNWVNENVPKPTMPTMPNVNMPTVSMPNMPGFLNKNKDANNLVEGVENDQVATDGATTDPVNVDQVTVEKLEEEAEAKQVSGEETKVTQEDGVSRASDETTENASYKTLESAKEMTKNMGSKFLHWCSIFFVFSPNLFLIITVFLFLRSKTCFFHLDLM